MKKIIRVNMGSLTITEERLDDHHRDLGGRGLTSALVAREVPPRCHPLGKHNKLIIAPGLLAGTSAASSGRLSVGSKSPLTGTIKESNAGGTAAHKLARLGIAALIIEGRPAKSNLHVLNIAAGTVSLEPAGSLQGLGNYDTVKRLNAQYGNRVCCMSIGQAGELKLSAATIAVTDQEQRPTRHCGRGGLGAVMGSKGLKAIVIDAGRAARLALADTTAFNQANRQYTQALLAHPVTGEGLPTYGTNILTNIINECGALPTRNFSAGRFERAADVSGEQEHTTTKARGGVTKHGCMPGCVIQCSSIYNDKNGRFLSKGPEYETVWAHGPNCGISDLDAIALMDRLDDDVGVDTIEAGAAIAIAMEAGIIPFGDTKGAIGLVTEIARGSAMGRIIGSGAVTAGKAFGIDHVAAVKGQALPAYDPRAAQGIGVTYATATMGADHTAGYCIATNILGCGERIDPLSPQGQAALSRRLQIATAAIDSLGLCLFAAFCLLDNPAALQAVCELVQTRYGRSFSTDDFLALGMRTLKIERAFNREAGFTSKDDRLPEFMLEDTLAPHNTTFMVSDEELDNVLNF
ncbi:MAG: aldehyde ferredoxin oxidoreductase [Deltaproteobacteria bacterium]|nr:aldehyde ferredoxin oxidoreductase [Deltaproteobacteria bacterium]